MFVHNIEIMGIGGFMEIVTKDIIPSVCVITLFFYKNL